MNPDQPTAIVIMGVAGSGKTTVGEALARDLGWPFKDADDFHPPANLARMSAGVPLTDADRAPWLAAIRSHLAACLASGKSCVVTCSALKQSYRDVLLFDPSRIRLVYLRGTPDVLRARLAARTGHFMKPAMLESQLAALEEPSRALTMDIVRPPAEIVREIRRALAL